MKTHPAAAAKFTFLGSPSFKTDISSLCACLSGASSFLKAAGGTEKEFSQLCVTLFVVIV